MTNREMIMVIKNFESSLEHIKDVAEEIISKTYDRCIFNVDSIDVTEYDIIVEYSYTHGDELRNEDVIIPIEWFNEEFDYVKAYKELLRKAKEEKRKAKEVRKKYEAEKINRAKELKEEKEYVTYLKLKAKYYSNRR